MPDFTRALAFTPRGSAKIIAFDDSRVRPGLTAMIRHARKIFEKAKTHESFASTVGAPGPDTLLRLLPSDKECETLRQEDVAARAIDASLLALHAIHDGRWENRDASAHFMQMQSVAARLVQSVDIEMTCHGS